MRAGSHLRWSESELAVGRKNNPDEMAIAVRFRRKTTLLLKAVPAEVSAVPGGTGPGWGGELSTPLKLKWWANFLRPPG